MIQVCYYKGCGRSYGEKEPLADRRETHGLCPTHLEIFLKEIRDKMEELVQRRGSPKILIVEDNPLYRQLLKGTLHDRFPSIEIDEAVDGKEALRQIESFLPDLIFMDIGLPGENGLELTKKVRARHPNIVVIILTGYDLPEYRQFSSQYTNYFFSKDSTTTETICRLVQSILPTPE